MILNQEVRLALVAGTIGASIGLYAYATISLKRELEMLDRISSNRFNW